MVVCTGRCLQRLDLSDNPMTGDVADSLAAMLQHQPHLRALNLNDTSLEDAGVTTIAQALANSGTGYAEMKTQATFRLSSCKCFWHMCTHLFAIGITAQAACQVYNGHSVTSLYIPEPQEMYRNND